MELVLFGEQPLRTAAVLGSNTGAGSLVIDAARLTFASPLDLVGVLAYAHHMAADAIPVEFVVPRHEDVTAYLQRMDVLRHLPDGTRMRGRRLPPDARTDRAHRLVEVTRVRGNQDDASAKVGRMVTAHYADLDPAMGRVVARACGELLSNAAEHGAGGAGAFLAAQTYTRVGPSDRSTGVGGEVGKGAVVRRFEFAICDTGIGVKAHLRRNPRFGHLTDDVHALRAASKRGVSGAGDGRGNGLFDLVKSTQKRGHIRMQLRSGYGEISVTGSTDSALRRQVTPRQDRTPGTWAWLTFQVRERGS